MTKYFTAEALKGNAHQGARFTYNKDATAGIMRPLGCELEDAVVRKSDRVPQKGLLQYPARFLMRLRYIGRGKLYNVDKSRSVGGVHFLTHKFKLSCPVAANAQWERLPISPSEGAVSKEARMVKPYLWLRRRFVAPAVKPDAYKVPTCPEACSPYLVQLMLPGLSRDAGGPAAASRVNLNAPLPDRQAMPAQVQVQVQANNANNAPQRHVNPLSAQEGPQTTAAELARLREELAKEKAAAAALAVELEGAKADLAAAAAASALKGEALDKVTKRFLKMAGEVDALRSSVDSATSAAGKLLAQGDKAGADVALAGLQQTASKKADDASKVVTKVQNIVNNVKQAQPQPGQGNNVNNVIQPKSNLY